MTRLAQELNAVNLGQGFPDYPPAAFVLEAAQEALSANAHQYSPPKGWPRLARAVSAALEHGLGFQPDADQEVTITHGATEAMYATLQALVEPGEEVIVLEPMYDMYVPQIEFAYGVPRFVALERVNGTWQLDLETLRAACSSRTKALILNTPHNPTGKVFTPQELQGIANLAHEFDFYVLSDEAYDRLVYDVPHTRIASLPGMRDHTITIGSAGKVFGATGWRIGWAIANTEVSAAIRRGHQWFPFCAATPVQEAVALCLERAEGHGYYVTLSHELRDKRDFLAHALRQAGFAPEHPNGGYFIIADTGHFASNTDEAARKLVMEYGVASIPTSVFYSLEHKALAPNALRFAFCKTQATLERATERLGRITT